MLATTASTTDLASHGRLISAFRGAFVVANAATTAHPLPGLEDLFAGGW